MVEVFATNVDERDQASRLVLLLQENFPGNRINFDLHDCDKILRVEGHIVTPAQIIALIQQNGYSCTILE